MEDKKMRIEEVRWLSVADAEEVKYLLKKIEKDRRPMLLMYRNSANSQMYWAIMHEQFNDMDVENWIHVKDCKKLNGVLYMTVAQNSVTAFASRALRRLCKPPVEEEEDLFLPTDDLDFPEALEATEEDEQVSPQKRFLMDYTPATIAQLLNEEVIGQEELTAAAADFLYYHVLRQLHPELPSRPMLITGPSGSGKTEVWRVIEKRFGDSIPISIMDGSNLSCEGWSGNYKLESYINSRVAGSGILVVDEFDKLARPKFSSGGANVSKDMQAEFLKVMEGEYRLSQNKRLTGENTKRMGLVLVGAFEELRNDPDELQQVRAVAPIGFGQAAVVTDEPRDQHAVSDETLISYGVMPEIVGRIAVKCKTQYLTDEMYMRILLSPTSRVAVLKSVLEACGADVAQLLDPDQLRELIATSRNNRTGVRWVAAQVEGRLLESIREQGLYHNEPQKPNAPRKTPIPA